jgi:hypothetical protein
MIELILLLLFYFSVIAILLYGVVLLITVFIEKISQKKPINFKRTKRYRKIVIPCCFVAGIVLNILYLSINPAHNFKTAYIEKQSDGFVVTILGRRNLMVHDPVSLLMKGTYIDSTKFVIPKSEGVIDGLEIPNRQGFYKIMKGKAISIANNKMEVSLFYDNYDDKKIDPSTWNGDYELVWRK